MTPLVRFSRVTLNLSDRPVLLDLNWSLQTAQSWAVTGPNGAGKSSFFRLVRGDSWPTAGERQYALDGRETRSPLLARERIALVSPELHDWYARTEWHLTGWQVVLSGTTGGHLPPYPLEAWHEERAREAVRRLGVEALMNRDVRSLSQGQRRQVLLARALASRPSVLILDEFWEGVDSPARARLRLLVEGLIQSGVTVLYSTHRTEEFLAGTTHHLRLEDGRITRQERAPQLAGPSPLVPRRSRRARGEAVLEIERASVYRGDTLALRDVTWTLRAGEHWAFLGQNGAGKSTLARLVAGEVHPAVGGHVRRFDLPSRATLDERRRVISLVSAEEQVRHRREVSGETIVASGFTGTVGIAGPMGAAQRKRLEEVTARLGVVDLLARVATELSHGQLKKLLFARALVSDARLLVLDEPFDYLDDAFKARLLAELEDRERVGTQFVFVVHRSADLPSFVTHALHLEEGRVASRGPLEELDYASLLT